MANLAERRAQRAEAIRRQIFKDEHPDALDLQGPSKQMAVDHALVPLDTVLKNNPEAFFHPERAKARDRHAKGVTAFHAVLERAKKKE